MGIKITTKKEFTSWLKLWIGNKFKIPNNEIDVKEAFNSYGLNSISSAELANELQQLINKPVAATIIFDYPNIDKLSTYLEKLLMKSVTTEIKMPPDFSNQFEQNNGDIAIIGMSCRFPGARNIEEFWELLSTGKNAVGRAPKGHSHYNSKYEVGFIENVDLFDAGFFNISPREAKCMDPQQRILLEVSYEALEDATIDISTLVGSRTGVFIGVSNREYAELQKDDSDIYAATGGANSIIANRLSYFYDLNGPSMTIDTACSSSLMAVHLACTSLKSGESTLAIVGGANLLLSLQTTEKYAAMGFLSEDSRCKTFDVSANGYARAEGVGVVILKPLKQALLDKDRIYATIKATATNQDGRSNGITAPNQYSQEKLLDEIYSQAHILPVDVEYVECHGTGTLLGDPIEAKAVMAVLGNGRTKDNVCRLGSVKTNLGHLETAAGIASLIKVALMIFNRAILPNLHFNQANPNIDFANNSFIVPKAFEPWISDKSIAGINSFGFGGTNVHAILMDANIPINIIEYSHYNILPISAKSEKAVNDLVESWQHYLKQKPTLGLTNICATAALGRIHYPYRMVTYGTNINEILDGLSKSPLVKKSKSDVRIAFIFTGQGAQWVGMARQLMLEQVIFREWIDACDQIIFKYVKFSIIEILDADNPSEELAQSYIVQPLLVAYQIALAELLCILGITPAFTLGHSLGEIPAAYIAGALSLDEALMLACYRGQVMQQVTDSGSMLAIEVSSAEVAKLIENTNLDIAAINSYTATIVSGDSNEIDLLVMYLEENDIEHIKLPVNCAFHSKQMDPLIAKLESYLGDISLKEFKIPMFSTQTGAVIQANQLNAKYWALQMRNPVKFLDTVERVLEEDVTLLLEIGPSSPLLMYLKEIIQFKRSEVSVIGITKKSTDENQMLFKAIGELYKIGCEINWSYIYENAKFYDIPHYVWQNKSYWIKKSEDIETEHVMMVKDVIEPGKILQVEEAIINELIRILSELMEIDPDDMDINKSFIELGADSIIVVSTVKKIKTVFNVKVSIRSLFEDLPTIEKLAAYIKLHNPKIVETLIAKTNNIPNQVPENCMPTSNQPLSNNECNILNNTNVVGVSPNSLLQLPILNQQDSIFTQQIQMLNQQILMINGQLQMVSQQLNLMLLNHNMNNPVSQHPISTAEITLNTEPNFQIKPSSNLNNSYKPKRRTNQLDFSIYFFGDYPAEYCENKYDLVMSASKFADQNEFCAVWIPERHFHRFGGFSPNPSVLCAALATITKNIKLRPGSVVVPLHNPIRIAEEWSLVDNLSGGRVDGMGVAIGWHANDFAFNPSAYSKRAEILKNNLNAVQTLWGGDGLDVINGDNKPFTAKLFPLPSTRELPIWVTVVSNPDTYKIAANMGANILTNLMSQSIDNLKDNILIYRNELAKSGYSSDYGKVTLLIHTFILDDAQKAREIAKIPFCNYLKSTISIFQSLAKAQGVEFNYDDLSPEDIDYYLGRVFEKYITDSALIGDVNTCIPIIETLKEIGVDEVAYFIDFGIESHYVLESLEYANSLKDIFIKGKPVKKQEMMTHSQIKLWNVAQIETNASLVYNVSFSVKIESKLNDSKLERAITLLLENNKILGAFFNDLGEVNYKPVAVKNILTKIDVSKYTIENEDQFILELQEKNANTFFDLANGPLIRIHVIGLRGDKTLIMISSHHIIADGVSISILINELLQYYFSEQVSHSRIKHDDFQTYLKQLKNLSTEVKNNNLYWQKTLEKAMTFERLSITTKSRSHIAYPAAKLVIQFDKEMTQNIKQAAKNYGCSLFMLMLGAYQILLYRLSMQEQVIVNVAHSGRFDETDNDFVGYSAQVLPLSVFIKSDVSLKDFILTNKSTILDAFDHQIFSFADICDYFKVEPNNFPFSNYIFNMEVDRVNKDVISSFNPTTYIDYDLRLIAFDSKDDIIIESHYNKDFFDEYFIRNILNAYKMIITQMISNVDIKIAEIKVVSDEEIIEIANNMQYVFKANAKTIHELFEEQVLKTPNNIALVCEGSKLTYHELNCRSNQLAHYLRKRYAIKPDDLIALCLDRSEHMLIAILGILKSGGAYVPLDPDYPIARVIHMINDIKTRLIITNEIHETHLNVIIAHNTSIDILAIDSKQYQDILAKQSLANLPESIGPNNLAYVVYTSGTTGKPKGVMIEHRSVNNFIYSLPFSNQDCLKATFTAPYIFDVSIFDIWSNLLNGHSLYIVLPEVLQDSNLFSKYLQENKINKIYLPAALVKVHVDHLANIASLTQLFTGVESLEFSYINKLSHIKEIVNGYGPTEYTVCATLYKVTDRNVKCYDLIPLGKAIANTELYVMDNNSQLLPRGALGELYIGGTGLARGYLNLPELTNEKFIPNPFIDILSQSQARNKDSWLGHKRLYKTGDLVRWLPDGNLEYIGRNDCQVKIRGYRIELGEIELALSNYPQVKQVVVIAHNKSNNMSDENNKYLVAYYCTDDILVEEDLFEYLEATLPEYMVPSVLIHLDKFPLTPNGKLEIKALPIPDVHSRDVYLAPRNEIEAQICEIYAEVLGITKSKIGINDDFFRLGGSSLLAISLINKINATFNLQLSITHVFINHSAKKQALAIQKILKNNVNGYEPIISKVDKFHLDKPVVFIHPGYAGAEVYIELIKMFPPEIPCYAIDSFNLHHLDNLLSTVDEMASYYVDLLIKSDINGPYHLVGWSLGGNIAIEMARQLHAKGKIVHHVHLLESSVLTDTQRFLANETFAELEVYESKNYVVELENSKMQSYRTENKAYIAYVPDSYNVSQVTLYKGVNLDIVNDESYSEKFREMINTARVMQDNGWSRYISDLEIEQLNTGHYDLLREHASLVRVLDFIIKKWHVYT